VVLRPQLQLEPRPYNTSEVAMDLHERTYEDKIFSQERHIFLVKIERIALNYLSLLFVLIHFALIVGVHLSAPQFLFERPLKGLFHLP
jgi:hypothetical protein